ncbi:MAG: 16S rRNA (cytosine(967)-C(5))-methyltransferase RsmB [Lachnospiraceae bacterium]|nr:16S rRNA (cytosine(967)-C(5))-methyltransferase RsmB [Lachnospiraceae bacterium]
MDAREIVLDILMDIEINGTFSNMALTKALKKNQFEDKQTRAFVSRLAEGVTESKITLDYIVNQYSKTKINKCKPMIRTLLRMGVYQIMYMDAVPDHAAVGESVKLARKHGFSGLSGFVNGVLRTIARNKKQIVYPNQEKDPVRYASVRYSMPEWLVEKFVSDYGEQAMQIIKGCFLDRPTTIRINTCKTDKETLRNMLVDAGIEVLDGDYDEAALKIRRYDFIRKVPGYKKGLFTVQDESSMCAVRAAKIKPGDIVMDVCAAPGGKTTAAAEYLQGDGHIYSMDVSMDKLSLIEENVERLGFSNVTISAHDATKPFDVPDADVVIADVPCSGLGIIGRKNDIKYRLEPDGIKSLVTLQKEILENISGYVKRGGTLLYSTCTINKSENEENVEWFLKEHPEYSLEQMRLFLPGKDTCDGFFFAVLKRG